MGKRTFAMPAIDESAILQIAQRKSDRYAADIKPAAQLMLTGNCKRSLLRILEDLIG